MFQRVIDSFERRDAAAAIPVHHVAFFIWLPHSIFNYNASWGIVFLHAFFVIFEVVPALWLTHLLDDSASTSERTQGVLNAMAENIRNVIGEIYQRAGVVHNLRGVGLEFRPDERKLASGFG